MNNLGLSLVQLLLPSYKYDIKCPNVMQPQYLTIHNTANDASARAEISYMIGNNHEVSYHWAVDDKEAIQAIPHNRNAWHCGDGLGTGNLTSIGIEICNSLTPNNPRYKQSEENGAKLAAIILYQQGWGIDRMRKHQDWSGKYCPHRILDNGDWDNFKAKVQGYLEQLKEPVKPVETTEITALKGGRKMEFTFTVDGDKSYVKGGVYYYNPANNTIRHLSHPDEWKVIKEIYKECYGKEMLHKQWNAKAPWYARFIQATGAKRI